jgi:hypothetical protein
MTVPEGPMGRGLAVFGERTGRYPIDPTVVIETAEAVVLAAAGQEGQVPDGARE